MSGVCIYVTACTGHTRVSGGPYQPGAELAAVIGASRRPDTVGRTIWDNIRDAGYAGTVYPVNPHARQIGGEPALASPADLPEHVDLAVIAVPAAAVVNTAEQCGQRGVHACVVITGPDQRPAQEPP